MGVVVDSDLVARVVALSGERTIKAAVTKALQEFIARRDTPRKRELANNAPLSVASLMKKGRRRR